MFSITQPSPHLHFGNRPNQDFPLATPLSERYAKWVRQNKILDKKDLEKAIQQSFVKKQVTFLLQVGKAWKASGYKFWPLAEQIFKAITGNPTAPLDDKVYASLAMGQNSHQIETQLKWYNQALEYARQSGEIRLLLDTHLDIATVYTPDKKLQIQAGSEKQKKLEKSRRQYHLQTALELATHIKDYKRQAKAEIGLGNVEEEPKQKKAHYLAAQKLALQANDIGLQGRILNVLGKVQENRNDRIECHKEALKLGEQASDKFLIAQSYWELGYAYTRNQDTYFKKALEVGYQFKNPHIIYKSYLELGTFARNVEKNSIKAQDYFSMAYEYAPKAEKENIQKTIQLLDKEIQETETNNIKLFTEISDSPNTQQKNLPKRFRRKPSKPYNHQDLIEKNSSFELLRKAAKKYQDDTEASDLCIDKRKQKHLPKDLRNNRFFLPLK